MCIKMRVLLQKVFYYNVCAPEANEKEDVKVLSTKSLMDIFCPTFRSDVTQKHACGMTLKCGLKIVQ